MKKLSIKQLIILVISFVILLSLGAALDSQIKNSQSIQQTIISILVVSVLLFFYLLSIFKDLKKTTLKTYSERIVDDLTSLPNRAQLLANLASIKKEASLALINVNDFHSVNDYYGTAIGDELLVEFADWLKDYIKDEPINLYHINADEFALLSTQIRFESGKAKECITKIEQTTFLQLQAIDLNIYVSAGIATGKDRLLQKADIALKTAKESELEMLVYDEFLSKRNYQSKLLIGRKLKSAVADDRIVPYYQKVVDRDGNVMMYEALMRVIDDEGLVIAPMKFLGIARQTKLNTQMSKILMKKSFEEFAALDKKLNINLFASDIASSEITQYIAKLINQYSLHNRVVFDVVQIDSFADYEAVGRFKEILMPFGVEVAIENFGAGYTNFVKSVNIGTDYVKIDRSLIEDLEVNPYTRAAIVSIVSFCKKAGIKTIAKHVSTAEIASELRSLNVDYMQGYYYGQPEAKVQE